MFFLSSRTKASFYNGSKVTFLVQKDCVDIIFKIKRGVYLTVGVHQLSEGRLLLSCAWGEFFERLKSMPNRDDVLKRLKKPCPNTYKALTSAKDVYFSYLKEGSKEGYVVRVLKAPKQTNRINDFIEDEVMEAAMQFMGFNLDMHVELEENCPFPVWRRHLEEIF